jgi:hypothetical protein
VKVVIRARSGLLQGITGSGVSSPSRPIGRSEGVCQWLSRRHHTTGPESEFRAYRRRFHNIVLTRLHEVSNAY